MNMACIKMTKRYIFRSILQLYFIKYDNCNSLLFCLIVIILELNNYFCFFKFTP